MPAERSAGRGGAAECAKRPLFWAEGRGGGAARARASAADGDRTQPSLKFSLSPALV